MTNRNVRIEELKPMRVAVSRATSQTPEMDAWNILQQWAGPRGLLNDLVRYPVFGYTCQLPAKGKPEYGYEFWIKLDSDTVIDAPMKEQTFPGGWYAVMTHQGPPLPEVWKQLWDWVQASPYKWRKTHELEHPHNPLAPERQLAFDLYLPIEKPSSQNLRL